MNGLVIFVFIFLPSKHCYIFFFVIIDVHVFIEMLNIDFFVLFEHLPLWFFWGSLSLFIFNFNMVAL
jgi:hypothetical protein